MTREKVAELFGRFEKASTWGSANPKRFYFWARGRMSENVRHLGEDDGKARYLWVPFEDVRDHVEPTGQTDSQNKYYRLKKAA